MSRPSLPDSQGSTASSWFPRRGEETSVSEPMLSPAPGPGQDRQIKSRGCFVKPEPGRYYVWSPGSSRSSPPAGVWCDGRSLDGAGEGVLKTDFSGQGGTSSAQDSYMAVLEASLQHKPLKDFEQER